VQTQTQWMYFCVWFKGFNDESWPMRRTVTIQAQRVGGSSNEGVARFHESESRTSPWKRVHQGQRLRKVSSNLLTISRRFEIRAL
jgi:hypothetical protein